MNPEDHLGLVWMMLRRVPHPPQMREDLFQQGCVGLTRACLTWEEERGAFSTWAACLILSEMRTHMRKCRPAPPIDWAEDAPSAEDVERRAMLRSVFAGLSQEERKLVIYRHVMGLTQQETAQRLGVSQMSVSRRERAVRAHIRAELSE